jgi:hypothetical protein
MTALMIGAEEHAALDALKRLAAEHPVDVRALTVALALPGVKAAHMAQMTRQSVHLPADFLVTLSIETGQPVGTCRHMSMSVGHPDRLPSPHAVWLVAEVLGFWGSLADCAVWEEALTQGAAINLVQPIRPETTEQRQ